MKGCRILCVPIIELQINYNISFKEALKQLKVKKKCKKILIMKRKIFAFWRSRVPEKSPLLKHHPQPSAKLPKIL